MPVTCKINVPLNNEPLHVSPTLAYALLSKKAVVKKKQGEFDAVDYDVFWTAMKELNK